MGSALATIAMVALLAGSVQPETPGPPSGKVKVEYGSRDLKDGKAFEGYAAAAEKQISEFFGSGFPKAVTLRLCASRVEFDAALAKAWSMPKTETWMVGAAGAEHAYFLSPRVWSAEATEHRADDRQRIARLVAHELTHAYHAQNSPTHDLDGLDPMAWFVEGLATYVSGQEDAEHRGQAKRALGAASFPSRLEDVWAGKARYGLSGSLVRFVDERYGRGKVRNLLGAVSNRQALKILGVSEGKLIDSWKGWLAAGVERATFPRRGVDARINLETFPVRSLVDPWRGHSGVDVLVSVQAPLGHSTATGPLSESRNSCVRRSGDGRR